jgi:hypothetical protein
MVVLSSQCQMSAIAQSDVRTALQHSPSAASCYIAFLRVHTHQHSTRVHCRSRYGLGLPPSCEAYTKQTRALDVWLGIWASTFEITSGSSRCGTDRDKNRWWKQRSRKFVVLRAKCHKGPNMSLSVSVEVSSASISVTAFTLQRQVLQHFCCSASLLNK